MKLNSFQQGMIAAASRPAPLHTIIIAVRVLEKRGIPVSDLLAGSGISVDDLSHPHLVVTHLQELMILSNALKLTEDESIGLEIGSEIHISSYGVLALAMLVSPTLKHALQIAYQYPLLGISYFKIKLHEQQSEAIVTIGDYIYRDDLRIINTDMCISAVLTEITDLLGRPPRCIRATLDFSEPNHADRYQEILKCPTVIFNAASTTLVFERDELNTPLPLFNEIEYHLAQKLCEQRENELAHWTPKLLVSRALYTLFKADGKLPSKDLAAALNISHRQMQREFEEAGTSYRRLRDEVRRTIEAELARSTSNSPQYLAKRLGYASGYVYKRAKARWENR